MSGPWTPVKVPFIRESTGLPEPLPTVEHIKSLDRSYTGYRSTVVKVSDSIVVKYGRHTTEREGQALLFLEHASPATPAPRLYAMFYDDGVLYLVMQRIPGEPLSEQWEKLSQAGKDEVIRDLGSIFKDLRSTPCPWPQFYGGINGGQITHHLFYSQERDPQICGPFTDERSFTQGLTLRYRDIQVENNRPLYRADWYQRHILSSLHGHQPTLTHSDVQKKNIILVDAAHRKQHSHCVAIVDWEEAGWFPDYWEYFITFTVLHWDDDWIARVEEFLPVWPAEVAMMNMLYKELFF